MYEPSGIPPFIVSDSIPQDRPIITAAVVPYTSQNEVVMFRHENGLIEFLGGHIETGESIEEAVRREAIEEGGVILGDKLHMVGYLVFSGLTPSYNPLYVSKSERFVPIPDGTESRGRLVFPASEVIGAISSAPDHKWKRRHVEMMTAALAAIQRVVTGAAS